MHYINRATDRYSAIATLKQQERRDESIATAFYVGAILGLIAMGLAL